MLKSVLKFLLAGVVLSSCQHEEPNKQITGNVILPFSIRIVQQDPSNPDNTEIILTEKNLRVLNHNGRDPLQYLKLVQYSDTLSDISELSPFALDSASVIDCLKDDRDIIAVITKGDTVRTIHLNGVYHHDLGVALTYINSHLPYQYNIGLDLNKMEEAYRKCKELSAPKTRTNKPAVQVLKVNRKRNIHVSAATKKHVTAHKSKKKQQKTNSKRSKRKRRH